MDNIDELIVYLCLVCHWTFDEACKFVKETPIKKLRVFVSELRYQKAIEDYQLASYFAMVICTWANAQNKNNHFKLKDFIGHPPERENHKTILTKAAEDINIKLPSGGIK